MNWYVTADRQHGAYRLPLLGPFTSMRAANAMVVPVRLAVERGRPDLAGCGVRAALLDYGKPGSLDLSVAADQAWVDYVATYRA